LALFSGTGIRILGMSSEDTRFRREVVIPTADEMARLEREIRRPNPRLTELNRDNLEAAFYIAQRATLRRGELAGLQWEHLNW
jgi:hypothetical protein